MDEDSLIQVSMLVLKLKKGLEPDAVHGAPR